ncbi:hypothetical protein N7G274_000726 [Stereocaulon virgatum]|uniref:Uncharacterized protein n=1 Tax=Stereocaulon virgatum TaxID=373712 RepID=A0ABR4APM5_9LECA
MTRGNEVGFSGIFTSSAAVEYANCERQPASDVMEITKIKNMEPGEVVRFFKEHLKWLVVNPAFNLVDGYSKSRTFNLEVKAV